MRDLVNNQVLVAALLGWIIAQTLKLPIYYLKYKRWNWAIWFAAGGMPSSHSSSAAACAMSVGLRTGFGSPVFSVALGLSLIHISEPTRILSISYAGFCLKKKTHIT